MRSSPLIRVTLSADSELWFFLPGRSDVTGPQYSDVASFADRVRQRLATVSELRDLEYEEPQHYPTVDIKVNRTMAGQLGMTADAVGSAVVSATASSRFVAPSYWRDEVRSQLSGAGAGAAAEDDVA